MRFFPAVVPAIHAVQRHTTVGVITMHTIVMASTGTIIHTIAIDGLSLDPSLDQCVEDRDAYSADEQLVQVKA